MGRNRPKRPHHRNKSFHRSRRTRAYEKDADQVWEDLKPENAEALQSQPTDIDLPGEGAHYCISCARYFITTAALEVHTKSKLHRRKLVRLTKEEPYDPEVHG